MPEDTRKKQRHKNLRMKKREKTLMTLHFLDQLKASNKEKKVTNAKQLTFMTKNNSLEEESEPEDETDLSDFEANSSSVHPLHLYDEDEFVDISSLSEARVVKGGDQRSMEPNDWVTVMKKIDFYRSKLTKARCLHDDMPFPARYIIFSLIILVNMAQHHDCWVRTSTLRLSLPKETEFTLPDLSVEERDFFDRLVMSEDVKDVEAKTRNEQHAKKLVESILDAVTSPDKDDASEVKHMFRNIVPLIDATMRSMRELKIRYAVRRNKGRDPADRAKMGYRVDIQVEFRDLHWQPTVGCGEISGGLPRCSLAKEWTDTLKLWLEIRDTWAMAQEELEGIDASNLVIWGFTVVGE
ncbi:hypothetical protein BC938DRAFT_478930 [Jimgerdemannia flammicorona]|uniref:Uncharacterized protein n=1 Tax=Jimgerdemannia flammicorona TaxID=994334 RepID=A0A433QLZ1_9FUNG|nr:hypothetical protein BC938DRAFT_478930 [Jimgerdemannia flammicorona]